MKEKYIKITVKVLTFTVLLVVLFFADSWILPQKSIDDTIVSYSQISVNNRNRYNGNNTKMYMGYIFFTQNGHKFSTQKTFVEEDQVTIKYSYIFKNITQVKSKETDYTSDLSSGFNGTCTYFIIGLGISATISLLMLRVSKNLSENGFQNIIILNSFLAFFTIYFLMMNN